MSASATRFLIVNADDFGLSDGVNRGIIEAHERGIVTSTSLMVRWPGAKDAASYINKHPELSTGLHVDLGEWAYREGDWVALYEVVPLSETQAVRREIEQQIADFRALTGLEPTHLDTHQHVHQREPTRELLIDFGRRLDVPVRHFVPAIRYCGGFYGQTGEGEPLPDAITIENLLVLLDALEPGYTELACHPGYALELDTMYRTERQAELHVLCDPRTRAALGQRGIVLCGFRDVPRAARRIA
jgi:chitin disaccharide deacetylase